MASQTSSDEGVHAEGYVGAQVGGSILIRPEVFDQSFVPLRLLGREEYLGRLVKSWKSREDEDYQRSFRLLLTGSAGVGKTALSLLFSRHLSVRSKVEGSRRVITANIDLANDRSPYSIIKDVYRQVIVFGGNRLASRKNMQAELIRYLEETSSQVLIHVEHGEAFFSAPLAKSRSFNDLIEDIFGPSDGPGANFNMIINSRAPLLRDSDYMMSLQLPPYTREETVKILAHRCEQGVRPGTYDEAIIDKVAEYGAGNLKKSITLLGEIFRHAERSKLERVDLNFAENVISTANVAYHNTLNNISKHEKLFLLAVAKAIKVRGEKITSTSEAENMYKVLCNRYNEVPKRHTTVWGTMNSLASIGLINKAKSGKGRRGKTTIISLKDIQPDEIIGEVEKLLSPVGQRNR